MDSNIKLSNVIGAPFQSFVLQQFDQRANHNSSNKRDLNEVLFLANKTAWVRLASSVNVIGRTLERVKDNKTIEPYDTTTKMVYNALGTGLYGAEDDLAKNWVLEAGTAVQAGDGSDGINLRSGISTNNDASLTGTTLGAYGLGGTQELGFVPMPGLTSVTVETLGRLGSLRQATVNFRVNNLNQLNVIEALYFRLGYSMILEWGHTQYYLNNDSFETNNIYGIEDIFNNDLRKEDIIAKINAKTRETNGNYGGMYGIVTNFNWNATQDGGYDCSIKLIGHGAIMDSLKTNQSYTLPNGVIQQFQKFEDFILDKIAKDTQTIQDLQAKLAAGGTTVAQVEITPPEPNPKSLNELINFLKKYDKNYTAVPGIVDAATSDAAYRAFFIQKNGFPLAPKSIVSAPHQITQGATDFIVLVQPSLFDSIVDSGVRRGYVKKFAGFYIQKGSQFVRVKQKLDDITQPGDTLSANINIGELEEILSLIGNSTRAGSTVYIGGFNDGLKDGQETYLEKMIAEGIKRVEAPQDFRTEIGQTFTVFADIPELNAAIGKFYVSVSTSFLNPNLARSYTPTTAQIGDAISARFKAAGTSFFGPVGLNRVDNPIAGTDVKAGLSTFQYDYFGNFTVNITVPNVAYSGNIRDAEATAKANQIDPGNNKTDITVTLAISTNIWSIFSNFLVNGAPYSPEPVPGTTGNTGDTKGTLQQGSTSQEKAPEGFSSALQAMLTIVQTESQSKALQKTGVYVHNILETTRKFYTDGALSNVFNAAGQTALPDRQAVLNKRFNLLNYAIKGFNSAIMADDSIYESIPVVDFKKLCKSYVIKYKQGGLEAVINDVRSPTYITLGYLLAFLNNMCLIYDSNKSRKKNSAETSSTPTGDKKHPFLYIDFNPNTNFCFTSPQQFSIDPTVCMIPMQKGQKYYKKLFPTDEIIKKLDPALFNTELNNFVTQELDKAGANFTVSDGTDSAKYKGNLMNILLNTQYLLDLCANMARNDAEHAVNLKPFLDQILIDVNKSLGGVNSFRASYIDDSNVVQIVDDQWVPLGEGSTPNNTTGQTTVLSQQGLAANQTNNPTTAGQLPLDATIIASPDAPGSISVIGTKSITREFRFNTTISSKLASKIAISAQAETGSVNSKDHSSYSHLNTFFEDRYSRSKEDPSVATSTNEVSKTNTKGVSSDQQAADLFNDHVRSLYSKFDGYNPKNIEAAKNYYLERMSKVKSSNPLTSASPYVSLELEITVDGISGIVMMNAFTVPNDRLPATYRGDGGKTKIAFIVTGLVHTIQNNEWLTKIKGQMIKLKTPVLIETPAKRADILQTSLATITTLSDLKPWSAGFISYVMRQAGVSSFPVNSLHTGYAQALRTNPNGFQVLDPSKTSIQVGDLIVANRENNLTFSTKPWSGTSHGDIITSISGNTATGIGGNVSNSVAAKSIGLSNGKLGKSDYFVILRPPQDKVASIVAKTLEEYNLWKKNNWKETSPEALPYLREYYKIIGITI